MRKTYFEELKPKKEGELILELLDKDQEKKVEINDVKAESELEDTQPLSKAEIAKHIFYSKCLVGLKITGIADIETFAKTIPFLSAKYELETMFGVEFANEIASCFLEENKHLFIEIE